MLDMQAFGMTAAEGLATDPQLRMLLEETQGALASGRIATGPLLNTTTGEAAKACQVRRHYLLYSK